MFKSFIDSFFKENALSEIDASNQGSIKYKGKNIEELTYDELTIVINENSNTPALRFACMDKLAEEYPNKMSEYVEGFRNSYLFSGSSSIAKTLEYISIKCPKISVMQRYQVVMVLIHVAEQTIRKEGDDEIEDLRELNVVRLKESGDILGEFCEKYFEELASPCKVEAIFKFLKLPYLFRHFEKFVRELLDQQNLKSDYKYKALLSIEKKSEDLKNISNVLWRRYSIKVEKEEDIKPGDFIEYIHVSNSNSLDDNLIHGYIIKPEFLDYRRKLDQVLLKTFIYFLNKPEIEINYRILSAQNCLVKPYISSEDRILAENILLNFLTEEQKDSLTNQQLADVADVLLQAQNPEVKQKARDMIKHLGFKNSKGKSIFDNAQNVHTKAIEQSVIQILEKLSTYPLARKNKNPEGEYIDYEYVYEDIQKKVKEAEYYMDEENRDSVTISLNRIYLDRALYSNMNYTLEKILLRVWSYVESHDYREELYKRLLQELVDMAGWCSSGYAFRLLNTLSGFGEFNIRISWTDQITANFQTRFTAKINAISDEDERSDIITGFTVTAEEDPKLRRKFLNFFMVHMPRIREELWPEFRDHIDDASFDLSFRKAIAQVVEGITLESGIKAAINKQKKKEEKLALINNASQQEKERKKSVNQDDASTNSDEKDNGKSRTDSHDQPKEY